MNTRTILAITLALNAVLAFVLWRSSSKVDLLKRTMRADETINSRTASTVTNQRVVVVPGDDGSPWHALAAGNYRECVERLRACGCPEETVRDIIIAAVSRRYRAQLVAQEEARYRHFKWWRGIQDADVDHDPGAAQEVRGKRDLELAQLFGKEWRQDLYKILGWKIDNSYWSFMAPEKVEQINLLSAKYSRLENDVRKGARGGYLLEEEEAQLKQLKEQKRAELVQMLTPKELEDMDARQSPAANWVKQKLPQAASEEEFLAMLRVAMANGKDMMTENSLLNGESPQEAQQRREAGEKTFQEQLKATLGDARYAELFPNAPPGTEPEPTLEESAERSRKELVKLAQKEGVSVEAATEAHNRIFAVIKDMEKKFGGLDKMSDEQQQQFNKTLKAQAEKIITETMGEKGKKIFRKLNHEDE